MFITLTVISLLAAASPTDRDPNTLTLFAEIALERGDCKSAAESYAAAAANGPAALARRASEVALACEHLPAAWESAQRWRSLAPDDPNAAAIYAAISLKLYRIAEAQAAVRTIAEGQDPDPKLAELAALLLEEGEAPAVLATLSGAIDTATASASALALLAQLASEAHDLGRSRQYAWLALKKNPLLFEARRLLARLYAADADNLNATAAALAAMRVEPKRGAFELVEVLAMLGQYDDARAELGRLRAAGTQAIEVERRLALLALESADLEEAKRRFGELAAQGPTAEAAVFYLADIAASQGDRETALAGFKRLADSSVAITARTRAADLLLERGARAEALQLLDDYIVEHPESHFEMAIAKANLLSEHGETESGLALLSAMLERHPQHPALEYDRAVLLERAGKVRESVALLERLLKERPDDPNLLNALGYTLADHSLRLAHAESLIQRALAVMPDNPAVIDSLGWVRFKRGDARNAATLLERAYVLGRDDQIAAHWGEALWKSGSRQEARAVWAAALEHDPQSHALQEVIGRFVKPGNP